VKKLFLVLLVLLAGAAGLSAVPLRPGGGDATPQIIISQADITVSITAPVVQASMRPVGIFVTAYETAFTHDLELICLWADQYQEGLLTVDEFKTLVVGRIAVMHMKAQTIDAIYRVTSLTLARFPLLC
jgi:hypothetical protein